jgi:putative membrane protein
MVKYNPKNWFLHILSFHKSDTLRILWPEMLLLAILTFGICYLESYLIEGDGMYLKDLTRVYALIGFALSLLLVFRTNTGYDRWWEGRKKWGELVNNSRNIAIKISTTTKNQHTKDLFKRMIPNFGFALKEHLRLGVKVEELDLTEAERTEIESWDHKPSFITQRMYKTLNDLKSSGEITEIEFLSIDTNLQNFSDIAGACERIKNTPIPYSYTLFLKKVIFIYVLTMPIAFVPMFSYWAILITLFVFYVLVSMEVLAEEIEDPFGLDANDLPTDEICTKVRGNVQEILNS